MAKRSDKSNGLRRYEFSERLAEILGESRRDLRARVTLLVSGGLMAPGPRGPGSPPATPQYAADLLIGAMAAPRQADTVEAVRCYRQLQPTVMAADVTSPRIVVGVPVCAPATEESLPEPACFCRRFRFGEALAQLLDQARNAETGAALARELFGVWVGRAYPVAGVQFGAWSQGRRTIITQRYEPEQSARPPAWLDPDRGGGADPGLFHSVFLPVSKLIEIGRLTVVQDERTSSMIKLGPTIANLVDLARQRRNRRPWEQFLSTISSAQGVAEKTDARTSRLVEVTDFGPNPGNLRMLTYVPDGLPPSAPLVVVLHGCIQTAASYDRNTGWSSLADRFGFALLLPEQRRMNNPIRCFNWFRGEDTERDSGEALSIRQMIEQMFAGHDLDRESVFVTGLSAGGAMTSVMLATYPDVFAGGAILAGVPYRSADGLQQAFDSIFQGRSRSGNEWGDLVRTASGHRGPWPRVSVWHGSADSAVKPSNATEIVKQWVDVHGLEHLPTIEKTVDGYPHRVWQRDDGEDLVECYTITGMAHGAPVDPCCEKGCGEAGPWFHDMGISSTYHIARFWGLTQRSEAWAAERHAAVSAPRLDRTGDATQARQHNPGAGRTEGGTDAGAEGGTAPGVDIQSILAKSFELAGLAANLGGGASGSGSKDKAAPGVDIQSILAKSFELAGLATRAVRVPKGASGSGTAAGGLAGWDSDSWQRLADDVRAPGGGLVLFGHASSGSNGQTGEQVRRVSREFTLGQKPMLRYVRRLDLDAAVNIYTTASFTVLVDDVPVDEVIANGMSYAETNWTERKEIDLARFAGRTVKLTFEVAANSNVCAEVFAKAWLTRVTVQDVVAAGAA